MNGPQAEPSSFPAEAGGATHLFLLLIIAMVVAFGAWTYYGRLDIVSTAAGEVIPSTQVKSVQHLEGGIVSEIKVAEGDQVKAGQALVVLESTASGADVDELVIHVTSLKVDIGRLETELAGAEALTFPAELVERHPALVRQANDMFVTRRTRLKNELAGQRALITQRKQEIRAISARLRNERKTLKLVAEQVVISENLFKDNLISRMKHLNLLKEASNLTGRVGEDVAALLQAEAALSEAGIGLRSIQDTYQEEVGRELDDKRRSLNELSSRLGKYEDSLKRTTLRSPVDGVIKTLHVVTVGGVVSPGGTVAEVVPEGDLLVIEAKLPPQDIGYVQLGQPVQVSLASADANRFGKLEGKVVHISADTIETAEGIPYYKVRITTERDYFERRRERYRLVPGVQVISSIRTGRRSVLEYLLDPFLGGLDMALRER